jgi:CRP-like cAMP-binding protein
MLTNLYIRDALSGPPCYARDHQPIPQDLSGLTQRVHDLQVELENTLYMSVPQRLGCHLVKLRHQVGAHGLSFKLPFTKTVLAFRLGIQNETLSRVIHRAPSVGINVSDKIVHIDSQKITNQVCDHCPGRDSCPAFKSLMAISSLRTSASPRHP